MSSEERFTEVAAELAGLGVVAGKMFGMPALKDARGKAFACLHDGEFACRLGGGSEAHTAALGVEGAHLFDPSGGGKPMKDWVSIPASVPDRWTEFATAAYALPPTVPTPRVVH
ncbi:MAG TPA: hypothetical protein VGR21_00980 [Cryptosporangiaceae bacterium]|nr:hypothetical protein [Cryptosporangiaceae bacterium]